MSKAIRRKATELLGLGMPKQAVYGIIVAEHPEAKPKKVAELLRYMPTAWSKERYGRLHMTLLGLIAASALLRIVGPVLDDAIRWDMPTAYLSLVPIASLLVGWSIYRWQGQVFEWVGWANVAGAFGLLKALRAPLNELADPVNTGSTLLSVLIGALCLYLAHQVFAKPKAEQDPLGGPQRFVFPVEGGL